MKRFTILLLVTAFIAGCLFWAYQQSKQLTHADIVIFSPHPDDSVLCCAGVIQNALAKGKSVLVVDVTNGDDFSSAAAALFVKPPASITPADMIRFAGLRQKEDIKALKILGLSQTNIFYLAYPDGLLPNLYGALIPLYHKMTDQSQTYTALVPDYHFLMHGTQTSYVKSSALSDITEIIRRSSPSEIYVTGPKDEAEDHQAVYWFVRDAVKNLNYRGKLYTAVIHGAHQQSLPSPTLREPLTVQQMTKKHDALASYKSELLLNDFPMFSFVKNEEVFWTGW